MKLKSELVQKEVSNALDVLNDEVVTIPTNLVRKYIYFILLKITILIGKQP